MKNKLTTAVGPQDSPESSTSQDTQRRVDAINQIFAIFRLNYHNQYFRAYASENDLATAQRLWFDALKAFSPETVLHAAKNVIKSSEFLPTLHTMIKHCEALAHSGLPDAHAAYLEACRAGSPKAEYNWSHLAVYYAGKASDWFFLANTEEQRAFPVFKEKYEQVCAELIAGRQLQQPKRERIAKEQRQPLDKKTNQEKIKALKNLLEM